VNKSQTTLQQSCCQASSHVHGLAVVLAPKFAGRFVLLHFLHDRSCATLLSGDGGDCRCDVEVEVDGRRYRYSETVGDSATAGRAAAS